MIILAIVVYVKDIIFGSDANLLSQTFAARMQAEFEMSMLGELSFFLVLEITQSTKGIHFPRKIPQKNVQEVWGEECSLVSTLMVIGCKLNKDDESLEENQTMYRSLI